MITQFKNPTTGRPVLNHVVINEDGCLTLQSYSSKVARIQPDERIVLGRDWNYSNTTRKYVYLFLGMDRRQIEKGIKEGDIVIKTL